MPVVRVRLRLGVGNYILEKKLANEVSQAACRLKNKIIINFNRYFFFYHTIGKVSSSIKCFVIRYAIPIKYRVIPTSLKLAMPQCLS